MRWTTTIIATIALLAAANDAMALSDAERRTASLCEAATRETEAAERVPRGLLAAISLKETGRWDAAAKRSAPWPWTVTSGGPGVHHETKAKALAAVKDLQARGVKNIDVGCMQVNLRYHPHAFDNLQAALDPVTNTNYAGAHLRQLREDHRSWSRAVERYHSSDPERGKAYRTAVYKLKYGTTTARRVAAREKATLTWKERQERLHQKYAAAKRARIKGSKRLRETNAQQTKHLRAAFEERRAKVFRDWEIMMKKRREAMRGKQS